MTVTTKFEKPRPMRAGDYAQRVWRGVKTVLWPTLLTLVGLTTLYVIFVGLIPILTGHHVGTQVIKDAYWLNHGVLIVHVITAIPPLVLGWMGFAKRIRNFNLKYHRWIGTLYCSAIWISALTGFYLGSGHSAGWATRLGYCALASAWFATTYLAYSTGRARGLVEHRKWMIRSYAITLAVVTVRPIHFVPMFMEVDMNIWPIVSAWGCWIPNVILAELYIARTDFRGRLMRTPKRPPNEAMTASV